MIRARGIRLESLARVKSMNEETGVEFTDDEAAFIALHFVNA